MTLEAPASLAPGDRGAADPAAAEDRHRVPEADLAGEHRRAEPGHDAAAEQSGGLGPGARVDLGALAGGHEGLLGEGADAERGREHGAVGEGHLLGGVVGGEAVLRPPRRHDRHWPQTARQLRTTKSPGATEVTSGPTASTMPAASWPRRNGKSSLMPALAVVQVGVAHPAGLDAHERLARTRVRDQDRRQLDGRPLRPGDDASYLVNHPGLPSSALLRGSYCSIVLGLARR